MASSTDYLPQREKLTRLAKEKANIEITNYFRKKSRLENIPEDSIVVFQDKNNNAQTLTNGTKSIRKKQTKLSTKKMANKKNVQHTKMATDTILTSTPLSMMYSKDSRAMETSGDSADLIHLTDDVVVVLDSSIETDNATIDVNSSIESSLSIRKKYDFDGLQTDDASDSDENNSNAPYWSHYNNRIAIIIEQASTNPKTVDNFFGCKAETLNSKVVFPTLMPIKRRRSTAIWNTPLRYSILPKY